MNKSSVSTQYNQFETYFKQEVENIIDRFLGERISNSQKEDFYNSVSLIFNKYSKSYIQHSENDLILPPIQQQVPHRPPPSINLYIVSPPTSYIPPPTFGTYYQPPITPIIQPTPYQMPISKPQPNIAPSTPYYSSPPPLMSFMQSTKLESTEFKRKRQKAPSHSKRQKKPSHSKSDKDDKKSKKDKKTEIKTFPYQKGDEFNGIIKYLTDKTGGNIHDNGTIEISSNNINRGMGLHSHHPKNLLNLNSSENYMANDGKTAYIRFDFKDKMVELSNYTVKNADSGGKIQNWVFEVSDDAVSWTEIDKRKDFNFNSKSSWTFDVKNNRFARYCQLRHDGPFTDMVYNLKMNSIELYGKLKMPKK